MKIQVIESKSNRPLANTKIQLQIKGKAAEGKDAGFISVTSDASGHITLDEKLNGQQISALSSNPSQPAQWTTASEGARLVVASTAATTGQRTTETTSGGRSNK